MTTTGGGRHDGTDDGGGVPEGMVNIARNGVVRRLICLFIGHDYDLRVYHKTGQVYAICRCCERLTGGEG